MKRKIDDLGRIVIPIEIRNELGIGTKDELKIELNERKIILSRPDEIDYKEIVFEALNFIRPYIRMEDEPLSHSEIVALYEVLLKGVNDEVDN